MLHIYPMRGIFYLPSIDTGTRDRQFNVSSERHPAGILLMKVLRFLGFSARGSNIIYIDFIDIGNIKQDTNVITTSTLHILHYTEYTFTFDILQFSFDLPIN